ncbi:hypothetical protein ACTG16_23570 [Aeromonas sp. 23P]|uniref:hypothetical protein n=1 Tax=Aeromonas sp. 23P TaxID=3452716 RepID=UPI003F7B07EC|nr:hypothetical protein [Aeromonas veronii]
MHKPGIKILVVNENTLCLTSTDEPRVMETIATRKREGVLPFNPAAKETICFNPSSYDFIRPATIDDFTAFGHDADDYEDILNEQEQLGYDASEMRPDQHEFNLASSTYITSVAFETFIKANLEARAEAMSFIAKANEAQAQIAGITQQMATYASQGNARAALLTLSEITFLQNEANEFMSKARELEALARSNENQINRDCTQLGLSLYAICQKEFAEATIIQPITEQA